MKPLALILVFLAGGVAGWKCVERSLVDPPPAPTVSGRSARVSTIPPDIRERIRMLRQSGSRAGRLRQLVILATRIPVGDIPRWFEGNYLEFLDGQSEHLFYDILTTRWLEADTPAAARWLVEHKENSGGRALAEWVKKDQAEALAFYRSLPGEQRSKLAAPVIEAVGEHSVSAALAMLSDIRGTYLNPSVIESLATRDRDAVCAHANSSNPETRRSLLRSVAAAWMNKDFKWVVSMMQQEGLEPKTFGDITNYGRDGNGGLAVIKNATLLPEGWLDQLSRDSSSTITLLCELDWLRIKSPQPGIPEDVLRRIQTQAARTPWWYNDKRTAGLELVAHGEWLPEHARSLIAKTLATRWSDDPEEARRWIDGLTGSTRDAAEQGYLEMIQSKQAADSVCDNPDKVIRAISDGSLQSLHWRNLQWSDDQIAAATQAATALNPEQSKAMLAEIRTNYKSLPNPVFAVFIARDLSEPATNQTATQAAQNASIQSTCQFASHWATLEPANAANWVTTLPHCEARMLAIKGVANQWSRYSLDEVRAWAQSLADVEREVILSLLDKPR